MNESLLRSDAVNVSSFGKYPLSIEPHFVLSCVKIPFFFVNHASFSVINF